MKRQVIQVTLAVAVSLTLAAAIGSAQSSVKGVADIPFDFHVGNATLPPGQYTVKSGFPTSDSICFQSKDGSRNAMAMTIAVTQGKRDGPMKLVFNRYGSSYFLSQVWNPDDSIVRGLWKSKGETELARSIRNANTTEVALKKH